VSYTYDANGNVLTVTDSQGTITREYDPLNRVTKYTDTQANTLQYAYNEVGNLVTLTYPDGRQVHYEYDAANRLVKVTDWAARVTQYDYDKNGRLISTLRPNGTQQTRVYDKAGQLVQQKDIVIATGEVISQFDFRYDAAGNITQELVTPSPERFQFTTPVNMTYTAANRLATYNGEAVQFDADGNMTKGPLSGDMANFVFDSRNRLMAAGNTAYRYDAENQRIGVSIDGQETHYVINSVPVLSQVLVRTQPDGTQTYYVYGLGLIGQEKQGQYLSYHFDLRGSTVALTDELTGQVVERFQYSPYGLLLSGEASRTPFLFNGMYGVMTDSNDMYYMRARYYHPEIRRFVNQDILLGVIFEGQTLNRYAFVTGKPISLIDPFGLSEEGIDEPGFGESLIPIWGSGKTAIYNFQNGQWGWGTFNTIMAISDIAMLKALVTGLVKGSCLGIATKGGGKGSKPINWSPKSTKTFGHTFNTHGAGRKNTTKLTGRAASTGKSQGQWLNNDAVAEILKDYAEKISGPTTIPIPDGIGQIIKPDGSLIPAKWATIIPKPEGGYRTAYPCPCGE
jgi:RHS repeat-associated protein